MTLVQPIPSTPSEHHAICVPHWLQKLLPSLNWLPGLINKSGRLTVLTGDIPIGETLSLYLEDGTDWTFFARNSDPSGTVYQQVARSIED